MNCKEYHRAMTQKVTVHFEEFFAPKQLWFEVAAFPYGCSLLVYFKDITASKNSIVILEQERQKYIDLFNLSPVPQWVYDLDTLRFLDVNEVAINHYGYSREEFLQMTIKDIRSKVIDSKAFDEIFCNPLKNGFFQQSLVRHQKKSGEIMSVCLESNSASFESRKAKLVVVIDRTAEIQASEALAESLKRYETVLKVTSDAVWDFDILRGNMLWNHPFEGNFLDTIS